MRTVALFLVAVFCGEQETVVLTAPSIFKTPAMCKDGEIDEYCKGHAATEIRNQSINETVRQVEPSFYRAERIHAFRGLSPALSVSPSFCPHLPAPSPACSADHSGRARWLYAVPVHRG